jgi:hypothetical protein
MKNQNDLIISIVSGVLAVGAIVTFYFTKPEVTPQPRPTQVNLAELQLPQADVAYTVGLPNAQAGGPGGGVPGGGGMGGARAVGGGGGGGMIVGGIEGAASAR